jgi:hypothetical protein
MYIPSKNHLSSVEQLEELLHKLLNKGELIIKSVTSHTLLVAELPSLNLKPKI